jgi:hypothetical protein
MDEWIDTGFHPDGSEWPSERNFTPRPQKDGESILEYYENANKNAPTEAPIAIQSLARLYGAGPAVELMGSGKAVYQFPGGQLVARLQPGGIEYIPANTLAKADAEKCAAQIFLEFYSSEWRCKLMRCSRCHKLDAPKNKPRESYPRGWRCRRCQHSETAMAATEKQRGAYRKKWFPLAVNANLEYEVMQRPPRDRILFITNRVNVGLDRINVDRVTRHKITHNLTKIRGAAKKGRRPTPKVRKK